MELKDPEMIGRTTELTLLQDRLENAMNGNGSTVFVSGEAGLGKTRLVTELINEAEKMDVKIIKGWCLAESLEPLMPIREALRNSGLYHLIAGQPPPRVISSYLMDDGGMLAARAEREATDLDADIFASMLNAVSNFMTDSLSMMGKEGSGLNAIRYDKYTILMESRGSASLACVIEGTPSEFLIDDMRQMLGELGDRLDGWDGLVKKTAGLEQKLSWFITSSKYDGEFLVDDPKLKQENLFDNVLMGVQRSSVEKPLIIFIDDLQWADSTTLNLLHYLARNTRKNRVFILGTYRPEDIINSLEQRTHQLVTTMQNMSREYLVEKIELKRLKTEDTEEVIHSVLGRKSFEKNFILRIHRETGGNPFFVLEVIKLLAEEGGIALNDEGEWEQVAEIDRLEVPSKVYDVIKRRLDRLIKEQKEILECASVVGEEFRSDVVGRVLEINRLKLLKNLGEMERTHKLIHSMENKYRFDHAKIAEVLYNGLIDELKQEYHRLIGDTLADINRDELDEVVSELAHHYYEAKDERAVEYLMKAGNDAKEKYANIEAVRFYTNALEMAKDDEFRVEVLENLGDVKNLVDEYDKAIEHFETVVEIADDVEVKARSLRKIGGVYENKGDYDESLKIAGKAKKLLGSEKSAELGRILVAEGNAYRRKGDFDEAVFLFSDAIKLFEEFGSERDMGNALRAVGIIHWNKGEYDNALKECEKSLAVMEKVDDKRGITAALNNIGIVHHDKGELDKALEFYGRSLKIRENIGDKWFIATSLNNIGVVHENRGELDLALEFQKRSLKIRENIGDKSGIAMSLNNLGLVHHDKGDLDRALEFYERSLEIEENIGDKWGIAMSINNIGEVHRNRGELDKALEFHERSLEIRENIGDKWGIAESLNDIGVVHYNKGELETAHEFAEKAVDAAVEIGAKTEECMGHRGLGMVYREMKEAGKARDEFEKAKEIADEIGDTTELAKLFYEYALLLDGTDEVERAEEYLARAHELFEDMGMKLWIGKCKKAL